jgi:hypothetical protein
MINIHLLSEDSVTFKIRGRSGEGSVIYQEKNSQQNKSFSFKNGN